MKRMIFTLAMGAAFISLSFAQESFPRRNLGIRAAIGIINDELLEGQNYEPFGLFPYFNWYLTKKDKLSKFYLLAEAQLLAAHIDWPNRDDYYESDLGVDLGLGYKLDLNLLGIYVQAGFGPHFISVNTAQQDDGWLFSDNVTVGLTRSLMQNYLMDFHVRFRHISNASTKSPNGGIDTIFAGIGIAGEF